MKQAIWWIKRDFRLSDNQALTQALLECDEVLPLFVFEDQLIACPDYSPLHVWAWQQALTDLKNKTAAMGGDVYTATGDLLKVLETLKKEYALTHIYSHEETGNHWTFKRDKAVSQWCQQNQIYWREYPQTGVIRGLKVKLVFR